MAFLVQGKKLWHCWYNNKSKLSVPFAHQACWGYRDDELKHGMHLFPSCKCHLQLVKPRSQCRVTVRLCIAKFAVWDMREFYPSVVVLG